MKILKIVGGVIVALVVVLVIVLMTVDVSKYKGVIQEQAKAATGRDVSIGDIKLGISLTPSIVVSDVMVANMPGGSRPQMLILKKVEAHTQLIPLLFGTINITKLVVTEPDVFLETDKQGKGNWEFSAASAAAPASGNSGGGSAPLNVSGVSVTGLKLVYKDAKQGMSADVAAKSLDVSIDGALQDLNVTAVEVKDGVVNFKDQKTNGNATVGGFELKSKGKITDLGITSIKVSDAKVVYKGEGAPIDAALEKLSLNSEGALDVSGTYDSQAFKANGTLAPIAALVSRKKPFPVKVTAEGMGLKGSTDLVVDLSKKNPSAKGTITIPEIDLSKGAAATQAQKGKAAATAPGDHVFPDTPLPWDQVATADVDIKASVGKLTLPSGLVLTDVTLPVSADGGKLSAKPVSFGVAGGTVATEIDLNAADKSLALKTTAKDLTAEKLAKEMKKGEMITQGPLDVNVNVRGSGNSVRAIMASLNGSVILGLGESKIRNDALNFAGGDILMQVASAINPLGNKDPYTVAHCGVANLQIANGVATTTNGIALVTDKMQVTSSGTINLGTERIDLSVHPKATGGLGVGIGQLASAVKVSGPLAHPGIGIDKVGAAKTIGKLGLAFATGGASILAEGARDRADTSSGDACQVARTWHLKK